MLTKKRIGKIVESEQHFGRADELDIVSLYPQKHFSILFILLAVHDAFRFGAH